VTEARVASPTTSVACSTKGMPVSSWIGSVASMADAQLTAPAVAMIATGRPVVRRGVAIMAMVCAWLRSRRAQS